MSKLTYELFEVYFVRVIFLRVGLLAEVARLYYF
jgi:hypothetical protein